MQKRSLITKLKLSRYGPAAVWSEVVRKPALVTDICFEYIVTIKYLHHVHLEEIFTVAPE